MAVIFCDGFDHYDDDHFLQKWDYWVQGTFGNCTIEPLGRFGSHCLKMTDGWRYAGKALPGGPLEYVTAGVAFHPQGGLFTAPAGIITFRTGGYCLCGVAVSATHQIYVFSGDTILAYGTRPIRTKTYQYIEFQVDGFHPSAGNVKVWLNEELVINTSGRTDGGSGYTKADAITLGHHITYVRTDYPDGILFDDFYVTDDSGSYCTGNLGDVTVNERLPDVDWDKEWTPSAGVDHYPLVDDARDDIDDDVSYITTPTVNAIDTYGFPNVIASEGDVRAVVLNFYARKYDSGARGISAVAELDYAYDVGNEVRVGGAYAFYQSVLHTRPGGGLWTIDDVNAAHFGPKLTT